MVRSSFWAKAALAFVMCAGPAAAAPAMEQPLGYESPFKDYRGYRDEAPRGWREVNDEVRDVGGHAGVLKAAEGGPDRAPAPGAPPAPNAPAAPGHCAGGHAMHSAHGHGAHHGGHGGHGSPGAHHDAMACPGGRHGR